MNTLIGIGDCVTKKRKYTLKADKKLAKRLGIKSTRKFNGSRYVLDDEVEPIASTPDMFALKDRAERKGRSYRFVYSKKNDTGLFYLGPKIKKNAKKSKR